MGWNNQSPICNFGMPSNPVMDSKDVWSHQSSDNERIHNAIERLQQRHKVVLMAYYIQGHCSLRKAAKHIGVTHKTVGVWLDSAWSALELELNSGKTIRRLSVLVDIER